MRKYKRDVNGEITGKVRAVAQLHTPHFLLKGLMRSIQLVTVKHKHVFLIKSRKFTQRTSNTFAQPTADITAQSTQLTSLSHQKSFQLKL